MEIKDYDFKILVINCIRNRLKLFNIDLPQSVTDLRELYFKTYNSQLDFLADNHRVFQRLDVYHSMLLVEEDIPIFQDEYEEILKELQNND